MGREVSKIALHFIDNWFETEFRIRYPGATQLLIIADYSEDDGRFRGGLAELAEKTNVAITLLHFPPGTTKWSSIEHRYSYFSGKEGCIRAAVIAYLIGRKKNTGIDVNYGVEMREREESAGWNRSTELFPDDCKGYSYTFMPDRWTGRGTRIGG
jgi:hypothetical protein